MRARSPYTPVCLDLDSDAQPFGDLVPLNMSLKMCTYETCLWACRAILTHSPTPTVCAGMYLEPLAPTPEPE